MSISIIEFLRKSGFQPSEFDEKKFSIEIKCGKIKILFTRTNEIGAYVQSNVADSGITRDNIIVEKKTSVEKILDLNYRSYKLVLAGSQNKKIKNGAKIGRKISKKEDEKKIKMLSDQKLYYVDKKQY